MVGIIAESARTVAERMTKGGPVTDQVFPPMQVVKAVSAQVSTGLPELTVSL